MEEIVKLAQVIGPLITVGIAVVGFRAWYWQLIAKRKFEIAEQAVTVWRRANDGLSFLRSPMVLGGEGDSVEIPEGLHGHQKLQLKRYRYVFERLNKISKDFEQVRLTQILVDLHISAKAGQSFDALFRVRHMVKVAAQMLVEDSDEHLPPEQQKEQTHRQRGYHRELVEVRVNGKPIAEDKHSRVLDEAQEALEDECRRILRPKTFIEFVFGEGDKTPLKPWSDETKKFLLIK